MRITRGQLRRLIAEEAKRSRFERGVYGSPKRWERERQRHAAAVEAEEELKKAQIAAGEAGLPHESELGVTQKEAEWANKPSYWHGTVEWPQQDLPHLRGREEQQVPSHIAPIFQHPADTPEGEAERKRRKRIGGTLDYAGAETPKFMRDWEPGELGIPAGWEEEEEEAVPEEEEEEVVPEEEPQSLEERNGSSSRITYDKFRSIIKEEIQMIIEE